MKISVALCTYNGERFLEDQLNSLVEQSRLPDELVVSDDGSTDGTMAILEAFRSRAPFPVKISRTAERLGFVLNFEQAISSCDGDVIAPSDQDDVWYPDKLARIEEVFASDDGIGLAFCDADVVAADLTPTGESTWQRRRINPRMEKQYQTPSAFGLLLKRNVISGNAMAFRARYLKLVMPFFSSWAHDYWISLLIAAVSTIKPLPYRLLSYRQHTQNLRGDSGSLSRATRRASHSSRDQFMSDAAKHRLLRDRLAQIPDRARRDSLMALVDDKIAHLEARGTMSSQRLKRIPIIVSELLRGNYAHYARRGVLTALRDVIW